MTTAFSGMTPTVSEWHIYGSSMLGAYNQQQGMYYGPGQVSWQSTFNYPRGLRRYPLSNHLRNAFARP